MNKNLRFAVILLVTILAIIFSPSQFHDLFRYYEDALELSKMSFFDMISFRSEGAFDFIYFIPYWICYRYEIPFHWVNGFFVFLYYFGVTKILDDFYKAEHVPFKAQRWGNLLSVCAIPAIFVLSIARTTACLAFFYLSLHFLHNRKFVKSIFYLALAVFTHVGVVLYISLVFAFIIISYILRKISPKKVFLFLLIGFIGLAVSLTVITEFVLGSSLFIYLPAYMGKYLTELSFAVKGGNGLTMDFATYFYASSLAAFSFLSLSSHYSKYSYSSFIIDVVVICSLLGLMFFQRACMLSTPYLAICASRAYSYGHKAMITILSLVMFILWVAVFLAYFYCFI